VVIPTWGDSGEVQPFFSNTHHTQACRDQRKKLRFHTMPLVGDCLHAPGRFYASDCRNVKEESSARVSRSGVRLESYLRPRHDQVAEFTTRDIVSSIPLRCGRLPSRMRSHVGCAAAAGREDIGGERHGECFTGGG